jgi:hypothetical protein
MSSPSSSTGDLYHYAVNGVTQGPLTARQLKQLADAGHIQAQTLIWREGTPEWVPAYRLKGLLPAGAAPVAEPPPSAQARMPVLIAVIACGTALIALIVTVLVLMMRTSDPAGTEPKGVAAKKTETPRQVAPPERKPDAEPARARQEPLTEISALELLSKCRADPKQTLREWKGKRVLVKVEAVWQIDKEEIKQTDEQGKLNLIFGDLGRDKANPKPTDSIWFSFPLSSSENKLAFIAKIKEYAAQRKRGERVVMSVTGVVTNFLHDGKEFLRIDNAVLN